LAASPPARPAYCLPALRPGRASDASDDDDGDGDDDDDGVFDDGALCPAQGPRSSLHSTDGGYSVSLVSLTGSSNSEIYRSYLDPTSTSATARAIRSRKNRDQCAV